MDGQFGIYFTGIGGTGVVTASRILARAAEAAGLAPAGLDQTGLSQKAGPVVSHLRLAEDRQALGAATVGDAGADLYLSGDILQAAAPRHLAKTVPGRTIAVVDATVMPTPNMLQSGAATPDTASLGRVIADYVGADRTLLVDVKHIAESVFADHLLANVVLLGAAFQMGGLPLSLADMHLGIMKLGRAADRNREAFEWGRWAAHDPAAVAAALAGAGERTPTGNVLDPSAAALTAAAELVRGRELPAELRDLLTRRTAQAIDYQNVRRGTVFLDLVVAAAARDSADREWELTKAVAASWYKVLTYKDEYEVARLHLAADYDRIAQELGIEGRYKVTYQLHPPLLRRLGMRNKLPMGKFYELGFRVLRPLKWLRGTPFDVFGWDPDRRAERGLIVAYRAVMDDVLATAMPYDDLVEIAESAMSVKGYAGIKEAAIVAWRERVAELRAKAPAVGAVG
jgi:indolepyruvate ferredoxin oxidoreductase